MGRKPAKNVPWYKQFRHWNNESQRYIAAYKRIPKDSALQAEIRGYGKLCSMRLVFESNLLENAGLSEGETRKVLEDFPEVNRYDAFHKVGSLLESVLNPRQISFEQVSHAFKEQGISFDKSTPRLIFGKKSRQTLEVIQHYQALLLAEEFTLSFNMQLTLYYLSQIIRKQFPDRSDAEQKWREYLRLINEKENISSDITDPLLITEEVIRNVHKEIGEGLLKDSQVPAGEYRDDVRHITGTEIVLPSPELIPSAMTAYTKRSNASLKDALVAPEKRMLTAAKISYEFARIHPFPDFNGRVSRLILMMILRTFGVPFPVTLKGNKKHKKWYNDALKRANKDDLFAYATLIAMRVVESFQEVDENIKKAGLPSILSFYPKDQETPSS
ncbi:MAG: Fic family protein [Chloroflexi bacterium]|nr:Fic family protein [Chloroflexota bacterium]